MRIFVGMETIGELRRRFMAMGHDVISADVLPAEDDGVGHVVGDVFEVLDRQAVAGWVPDLGVFHPTCTYHTLAAAWAFNDPDFDRYPGAGYHQCVKPGTLTGAARRAARRAAEADCERIKALPFVKVVENPRGTLPTRTSYGAAHQVIQPFEHGDDASKATCLWFFDAVGRMVLGAAVPVDPANRVRGRMVEWPRGSGKMVERWSNQTDSGQNNVTPGADRWKDRSRTYPGVADAVAGCLGRL